MCSDQRHAHHQPIRQGRGACPGCVPHQLPVDNAAASLEELDGLAASGDRRVLLDPPLHRRRHCSVHVLRAVHRQHVDCRGAGLVACEGRVVLEAVARTVLVDRGERRVGEGRNEGRKTLEGETVYFLYGP